MFVPQHRPIGPAMSLRRLAVCAAVSTALAGAVASPARAAEPPRAVMFVFDGSGSMWGRIDGDKVTKLQAARDALRRALPALPAETVVGLTSFGHRRKGDCGDVETLVELQPGNADGLLQPIEKLSPRGKGPLVLAIREAAKALGDGRRSSIVLIHDGADNCQQDACAAAAEIAKLQPGLQIHTVGLVLEPEDARKSACIAAATGGQAFDARDTSQIDTAVGEAIKLASLDASRPRAADKPSAPAQPVAVAKVPPAAAVAPVSVIPGLDVTAALAAGGTAITAPLRWRVSNAAAAAPTLFETESPRLSRPLASGRYIVEARFGLASARQTIDVGDGPAKTVQIALDAGVITPAARAYKDGDILSGVAYSIRAVTPSAGAATGSALWIGRSGGSDIVLPVGTYVVRAETGLVKKEETVTLTAGSRKAVDFLLGTGQLDLTATLADDGPALDQVTFIVAEDDPDSPAGRREVTRSAAPQPEFVLPAGTYYVTARTAGAEARQRVAVGAGDIVKRTISLGVSRLTIVTQIGNPPPSGAPPILTRISRLDGDRGEVARSAAAVPEFLLPAGRYQVSSQAGLQNVRSERTVEIKPGGNTKLTVPVEGGHIVLKVREATSIDQFWEVRDSGGQIVWRTTQSEAKLTLAPGRYVAHVEWRGRRLERAFDVKNGEQKTIVLGAE